MKDMRLEICKEWLRPTADSNQETAAMRGFVLNYIEQLEVEVRRLQAELAKAREGTQIEAGTLHFHVPNSDVDKNVYTLTDGELIEEKP